MEQSSSLPITGLTYTGVGIIGLWMVNRAAGKLFDSVAEPVLTPLAAHVRSFLFERSATAISKRLLTLYSVILWFMFATVFFAVGEINRWQMKDWNGAVLTLMFVPFMMPVVFKAGTFIRQPPRGFQSVMALGWIALALSTTYLTISLRGVAYFVAGLQVAAQYLHFI